MQFRDATNNKGLVDDVCFLTRTTTASYAINDIARNINQAYHDVARLIWTVADDWQYDDSNKTDLPIATTNLVHSQQDYELPSTAQMIERVEVLDSNSNYQLVKEIDKSDVNIALSEYYESDGLPIYYDLMGRSVFLYPAPSSASVTTAAGLKLYFGRNVTEFAPTATTATPGFATAFHRILSVSAALDFEQNTQRMAHLERMKDSLVRGLIKFYSKRHKEYRTRIKPRNIRRNRYL